MSNDIIDPVPTLDTAGWVTGVAQTADRLMAYFLVSRHSQSYLYQDQVISLPKLVQEYGKNMDDLCRATQTMLQTYFQGYFDAVDVKVSHSPLENDAGRSDLQIALIVRRAGTTYSLGRLVTVANSTITQVVDLNTQ